MVSNTIFYGAKTRSVFFPPIEKLIAAYQESKQVLKKSESPKIHVDEIASKLARFYEKVRKIVDWKEENLLRRGSIERILKRNLFGEFSQLNFIFRTEVNNIAQGLVTELIRGGYLPNDEIPDEKIPFVQGIINKYLYLLRNAPFSKLNSTLKLKEKVNFYDWILAIAACEIEESLSLPIKENGLIEAMTDSMVERIKIVSGQTISEEEKYVQTYIAVQRTLFDLDDSIIAYHLIKLRYSQWLNADKEFARSFVENIFLIRENLKKDLHHPLSREFFNLCETYDTVFMLSGDVLDFFKEEPRKINAVLADKENLHVLIKRFYEKRYLTLKSRLYKLAVFSTLSVFVSNWFTYFVVEVPVARLFYEGFNFTAAAVDFLLPSAVMFVLVAIIKPPAANNLPKLINLTDNFVYSDEEREIFEIKLKKKTKPLVIFFISLFYFLTCITVFGLIAWVFYLATIPVTSVVLDTIQIAINVFAALVVRNKARELTVEEKSTFWEFLLDIISLPIAEIGSWLASKWREYNIVAVFFNVVIETPLVGLVDFIEDWRDFLKRRKAEIH